MPAVAIVTDTDASLPKSISDRYGIKQVLIVVNFGKEVLKTGVDIDDKSLFGCVNREGKIPTTSAPSPGDFSDVFAEVLREGAKTVLCYCVSSEISATYGAAISASKTMPDRDIRVFDTRSLSMGQGFVVMAAAEATASRKIDRLAMVPINAEVDARHFNAQLCQTMPCSEEIICTELTPG
jgi:DegV family protein with EDD domain